MAQIHFLEYSAGDGLSGDLAHGHFLAKRPDYGRFDSGAKKGKTLPNGKVMLDSKSCRAFQIL
jgi:hypothetical protein